MTTFNAHYGTLNTAHDFLTFHDPETMVRSLLAAAGFLGEGNPTGQVQHLDELRGAFHDTPLFVAQRQPIVWSVRVMPGHDVNTDVLLRGIEEIPVADRVAALLEHMMSWAEGGHPLSVQPLPNAGTSDN